MDGSEDDAGLTMEMVSVGGFSSGVLDGVVGGVSTVRSTTGVEVVMDEWVFKGGSESGVSIGIDCCGGSSTLGGGRDGTHAVTSRLGCTEDCGIAATA